MVQKHGDRDAAGGGRVSIDPRSTVTDTRHIESCWRTQVIITIVIYYFTSLHTGICIGSCITESDDPPMFDVCEHKAFSDLSVALTKSCKCGALC